MKLETLTLGYMIQDTGMQDNDYMIQNPRYRVHDTGYRIQGNDLDVCTYIKVSVLF